MDDFAAARRYARAYARWRCGGNLPLYKGCPPGQTGRGKLDPVYVECTEGRDEKAFWSHFSSCGCLPQSFVWHMGVRAPYVNRSTMPGGWLPGRNLLHFYDGSIGRGIASPNQYPALHEYVKQHGPPAIKAPADYVPSCGDIGFIWTPGANNAHTFMFGDMTDADHVENFSYGAGGMTQTEFPGAHVVNSKIDRRNGGIWFGQRKLQYIVPLTRVIADSSGLPDMSGESLDEMESRVP